MALAVTVDAVTYFGNMKVTKGRIQFDSSYATGGETLSVPTLGLAALQKDVGLWLGNLTPGYRVLPSFQNVQGTVITLIAERSAGSAGPFAEVPNATDLSGLFLSFEAHGWG